MKQKNIFVLLIVISLLSVLSACSKPAPKAEEKYSSALIVVPEAKNVSYVKHNGADYLNYDVNVVYPATELIEDINSKLEKQGWKSLQKDNLNPDERKWTEYSDVSASTKKTVHQWLSNWGNSSGGAVHYALRYEYPEGKEKNLNSLKIAAIYIPSTAAKNVDSQLNELKQKHTEEEMKSRGTGGVKENIKFFLADDSPANGFKEVIQPTSNQKMYIPKDPVITSIDIATLKTTDVGEGIEFRLELNAEGAKKLHAATKNNIGKRFAFCYNDKFCNAPVIREAIDSGSFMAFKPKL